MSGLAGILAGRREQLVGRWHSAEAVTDVRHTVEHAGWNFGYLDGWTHQDKAATLAAMAEALSFPDWFGQNLDALVDCLREVPDRTVLLWDGWGPLAREDADTFAEMVDILRERGITALLRGEGPDVGIDWVD